MKESQALLEVKNLHALYTSADEEVRAVNGVSLSIGKGETLGLVGETGAGKTTTALSIMRLLNSVTGRVTEGEIIFNGENLLELPEGKMRLVRGSHISMIFQDPMTSLDPVMTVGDQILEVLLTHDKRSKAEMDEKVDELLNLVGIPPSRKTEYAHQFSGGMKQRVVIAIALACRPELIIADEPTTALDVTIQAQVLDLIDDLREQLNTSMLLITHDLGVVAEICDKVAIMYAGEIIETGTTLDVFDRQKSHHPYTVGLFGSIPDLKTNVSRLSPILGLMPDPRDLPLGCKFHPRCPDCMEICKTKQPGVAEQDGHMVRCHKFTQGEEAVW